MKQTYLLLTKILGTHLEELMCCKYIKLAGIPFLVLSCNYAIYGYIIGELFIRKAFPTV